jgi:hypothetical protein
MHNNFNRQFIMLDFQLLEDPTFFAFVGSSEFAIYLVLRRHVWRGSEPHYMGLHDWYLKDRKLVCSLDRDKLATITGVHPQNISTFITSLERRKVIERKRTGRQNIYVLGEWIDVKGDGSLKIEWFYLDGVFGLEKSDVVKTASSDVVNSRHQTSEEMSVDDGHNNIEENIEENTVKNVTNGVIKNLEDVDQPSEKREYIAAHILDVLGDQHSLGFYRLVAAKIPEHVIYQTLAEIKADGARKPAAAFTHRMKLYALEHLKQQLAAQKSMQNPSKRTDK